ncbi:DUF4880 domain-containing protein [Rhabdochromatium marinum]|uniref:DUF4880 domain-containing protein n=1 Tax=Rhabdochromatium marinum TaxID=48729 RepID=UPI001903EA63|nr:DUF4880 domain-containing protein [Rhabdochromatium marinum]MBK1648559.1 hypothetical protein [Rhabdochromatium marinum]
MPQPIASFFAAQRPVLLDAARHFAPMDQAEVWVDECRASVPTAMVHPLHNFAFYRLMDLAGADLGRDQGDAMSLQHFRVLRQTLEYLPPLSQQVWAWMRLDGLGYAEIGKRLHLDEAAVANRVKHLLFCASDDLRLAADGHGESHGLLRLFAHSMKGRRHIVHQAALNWFARLAADEIGPVDSSAFHQWVSQSPQHVLAYARLGALWADSSLDVLLRRVARQFPIPVREHLQQRTLRDFQ